MSDVPVEPPVDPPVDPEIPVTETQVTASDAPADVQTLVEPPAPDLAEPPLATPDANEAVAPPIGVYPEDTEVRPTGGRINNSQRQIKLRTVPDKIIKRIADGT